MKQNRDTSQVKNTVQTIVCRRHPDSQTSLSSHFHYTAC